MDRKEIVKTLSEFLGAKSKYLGAPSFAYEIKTEEEIYIIDREGKINTSQGMAVTLEDIINPKHQDGNMEHSVEEKIKDTPIDCFELEIPFEEHTGRTLLNVVNMLYSKQKLIIKGLEINESFMDKVFVETLNLKSIASIEEFQAAITEVGFEKCKGLGFNFEKRTLIFKLSCKNINCDKMDAFKELAILINQGAKKLKHASFRQAQEDNPKYALRTWLTRLGMNGSEYKVIRKTLLSNLEGSGAFRIMPEERRTKVNG
ncbi:virulence-related protein [Clostridium cochlearium]|uniref:virulence-related protein n=1 Tax=Clostridium cochlearium TaxID=1494 RepID=UPI0014599FFF|nr:virulence-related protein [Clostridium cochlearium]MBV1817158.1 hypothetical protein [Bacteroidales bacterium MSK.15.36]MCG4579363.1 virulence-related protein [Clostridium cochlearium]NME94449.1 virulence-related protein [Clostridium cochlearium]NSJ90476.1 virulence-related protein [Coprococcus sp. MSK.21.13]